MRFSPEQFVETLRVFRQVSVVAVDVLAPQNLIKFGSVVLSDFFVVNLNYNWIHFSPDVLS